MPSSSKSTAVEHLNQFSAMVEALKNSGGRTIPSKETSGKKFSRTVSVVSTISDLSAFLPREAANLILVDVLWAVPRISPTANESCLTLISTAARWASRCEHSRMFLRDDLRFLSTLTSLLLRTTSTEKRARLIECMRPFAMGVRIARMEAFIIDLVPQLIESVVRPASPEVPYFSLFVLTSLCRENSIVAEFVISQWPEDERRGFFAKSSAGGDPKMEVLQSEFKFCLSEANLSSMAALSPHSDIVKRESGRDLVSTIGEAFCAAHSDGDHLTLRMLVDFMARVCKEEEAMAKGGAESLVAVAQQVVLVSDCIGDGSDNIANESAFALLRTVLAAHPDPISILDFLTKALTVKLERGTEEDAALEAIGLVADIASVIESHFCAGDLEGTRLQDVKFQMEPLAASLCEIALESRVAKASATRAIDGLISLAKVDNWQDIVRARLRPAALSARVEGILSSSSSAPDVVPLAASIVILARTLRSDDDKEWKDAHMGLLKRPKLVATLMGYIRGEGCSDADGARILQAVAGDQIAQRFSSSDVEKIEGQVRFLPASGSSKDGGCGMTKGDYQTVQDLVGSLRKAAEVDEDGLSSRLGDVLDLGDLRLRGQQQLVDNLKVSLRSAEETALLKNERITILENELYRTSSALRNICLKNQATERELADKIHQYDQLHDKATEFRNKTNKELESQSKQLDALQSERDRATAKAAKYTEQIGRLTETIKEHQHVQEELQAKLRSEAKTQAELSAALEKREEKLKKKDRALEEQQTAREKAEAELETARKEMASLQALNRRQEAALSKKDKQMAELNDEITTFRSMQEQIMNISSMMKNKK